MTPASIIPVFGSQRPYADLNFAGGSFGLDGRSVSDLTALPGFTFTRASLAMGYDATGRLVYGPNNQALQSQTFDNASWAKTNATVTANAVTAPDGTATADKLVEAATVGAHYVGQTLAPVGIPAVASVYAKAGERTQLAIQLGSSTAGYFNLSNGTVVSGATAGISDAGNGWYRCWVSGTPANNNFLLYTAVAGSASYSGDGTSGIFIWGAQLEDVTYQTTPSTYNATTTAAYYGPRLVYDPVTLASQGILVEEARTNLLLNSQALDNVTWSKAGAAVTADQTASPDGTTNADTLTEDSSTGRHFTFRNTAALSASTTYTFSVFLKYLSRQYVVVAMKTGASVTAYSQVVDVQNRTLGAATNSIGSPTNTSSRIDLLPNGWCRVTVTIGTGADTNCFCSIGLSNSATPSYSEEVPTYTGNGTGAAYLFGAQLELGQGASSPVPTTTAAVTRAADVARLTGLTLAYPVSLAAGFIKNFGATTSRVVTLQIDGNNFSTMGLNSAVATRLDVAQGGSFQAQITGTTPGLGVATLEAGRVATNDVGFAAQGTFVGTDVSATMPSMPTAANIGMFSDGGSEPLNGTISRIRIYNRALPDAQLQSLTT